MAKFCFCVLTALFCGLIGIGQSEPTAVERVSTITVPTAAPNFTKKESTPVSQSTTERVSTITVPTVAPNVTKEESTLASPSTTEKSHSTEKTTTELSTNTSTTENISTSTSKVKTSIETSSSPSSSALPSPSPTPSPSPSPLPAPDMGTWTFPPNKTANVSCIMVQFAAQLKVTYTNGTKLVNVSLNVPANASVSAGSCAANGTAEQWLTISWPAPPPRPNTNTTATTNNMTLWFHSDNKTKTYELKSLNVSLAPQTFPNSTSLNRTTLSHGAEWTTPLATSYRCLAAARLNLTAAQQSVVAALTLSHLQVEAFRTANGTAFSAARDCSSGDVPDAVPIAVGCALGGLVLVVLIAYLVGRRRSAARGYLSM